jgi:hypothetical protein
MAHPSTRLDFEPPIHAAVLSATDTPPSPGHLDAVRQSLAPADTFDVVDTAALQPGAGFDVVFVARACGPTPVADVVCRAGLPALCIDPHRGYHPYHAAFYHDLKRGGGMPLPANLPDTIEQSIRAVRRRLAIRGTKLIVADPGTDESRNEQIRRFTAACQERLGVEILVRTTDELKARASDIGDAAADAELKRWYADLLEGPGAMDVAHMLQVARLYLAQRAMLEEAGAAGITPYDIKGFLLVDPPEVMPNVSYGPLVSDGYLVCEEADIEALTTELLLYAGLGTHPTMSNIYFLFRDQFGKLATHEEYTNEMELADTRQCFEDNHVTISHFSTSGILPPDMMEETRYTVRETLPAWPGQSMIAATPKLGPVAMARLDDDAAGIHLDYGEADGLGFGDHLGWYRGRWFVRLPDAGDFAGRCLHQHYVIARDSGEHEVLETLLHTLLGITRL